MLHSFYPNTYSYADIGIGGVTVTDTKTSDALFEIRGVRPFAHLEFARGFVIFDTGNGKLHGPQHGLRDSSLSCRVRTGNMANPTSHQSIITTNHACGIITLCHRVLPYPSKLHQECSPTTSRSFGVLSKDRTSYAVHCVPGESRLRRCRG